MNAVQQHIASIDLSDAEALFAVTIARDARGNVVPTIHTVMDEFPAEMRDEMRAHLEAIVVTMRKAYPPKG